MGGTLMCRVGLVGSGNKELLASGNNLKKD